MPMMTGWLLDNVDFIYHANTELLGQVQKTASGPGVLGLNTTTHAWRQGMQPFIVSAPESAIQEVLAGIPNYTFFKHADQLVKGMTSVSPRRPEELLENCNNLKVRRLFFGLAERQYYQWLQKLDHNKVSLGRGNRMLVKGGRLNKKYKITIPEINE